jgi:hypothetical protein
MQMGIMNSLAATTCYRETIWNFIMINIELLAEKITTFQIKHTHLDNED